MLQLKGQLRTWLKLSSFLETSRSIVQSLPIRHLSLLPTIKLTWPTSWGKDTKPVHTRPWCFSCRTPGESDKGYVSVVTNDDFQAFQQNGYHDDEDIDFSPQNGYYSQEEEEDREPLPQVQRKGKWVWLSSQLTQCLSSPQEIWSSQSRPDWEDCRSRLCHQERQAAVSRWAEGGLPQLCLPQVSPPTSDGQG